MKRLIVIVLLLTFLSFTTTNVSQTTLEILPQSEISVVGSSNVNEFNCEYSVLELSEPITISFVKKRDQLTFKNAVFYLKNNSFDCGNVFINKDFNKMLKTKEHPQTSIELYAISTLENNKEKINAVLGVTIANIEKSFRVPVSYSYSDNKYHIKGVVDLNLNEFRLELPQKLFGLVVVNEKAKVFLDLKLQELKQ